MQLSIKKSNGSATAQIQARGDAACGVDCVIEAIIPPIMHPVKREKFLSMGALEAKGLFRLLMVHE